MAMDAEGAWVDLLDPTTDELESALPFTLHASAATQLLRPAGTRATPRPKIESHGSYILAVFVLPVLVEPDQRTFHQEIDLILTPQRVITVRKTPRQPSGQPTGDPPYDTSDLRVALKTAADRRPGTLAYLIADDIAESYLDLLDGVNAQVEDLEDRVEADDPRQLQRAISDTRHSLLGIRRTLSPTRDAVRLVVDGRADVGENELFPHDIELHFGDVYDKLLRATEGLEAARDLVGGVRDYLQSKVANDQNEVMKRLTVIASLLLLPTFIVGLYGQNFSDIPELNWSFGYAYSWALILVTTVAQIVYFRRKRWI